MLYEEIAEKTKATLDKLYKSRAKEECDYPIGHKRIGFRQYENNR